MESKDMKNMVSEFVNKPEASVLDDAMLDKVSGGSEMRNLSDRILERMDSYERYTYNEIYKRLEAALSVNDRKEARHYYNEAVYFEQQMKKKYDD